MKKFVFLSSILGLLVLSACKITTDPGVGGNGGSGGSIVECETCSSAIANGTSDFLCEGTTSEQLYLDLTECLCNGVCAPWCGDNLCAGDDQSADCNDCLLDESPDGCGQSYLDCDADF